MTENQQSHPRQPRTRPLVHIRPFDKAPATARPIWQAQGSKLRGDTQGRPFDRAPAVAQWPPPSFENYGETKMARRSRAGGIRGLMRCWKIELKDEGRRHKDEFNHPLPPSCLRRDRSLEDTKNTKKKK